MQRGSRPGFVFETGGCWESLGATLLFLISVEWPLSGVPFLSSDYVPGLHILPPTKALADLLYVDFSKGDHCGASVPVITDC